MEVRNGRLSLELDPTTGSIVRLSDQATRAIPVAASGERARFARLFRVIAPRHVAAPGAVAGPADR